MWSLHLQVKFDTKFTRFFPRIKEKFPQSKPIRLLVAHIYTIRRSYVLAANAYASVSIQIVSMINEIHEISCDGKDHCPFDALYGLSSLRLPTSYNNVEVLTYSEIPIKNRRTCVDHEQNITQNSSNKRNLELFALNKL